MFFPHEIQTMVWGEDGFVYIEQFASTNRRIAFVKLSIHQFSEIFNREKSIIEQARESGIGDAEK